MTSPRRMQLYLIYGKDFVPAGRRLVCPHGRLHLATCKFSGPLDVGVPPEVTRPLISLSPSPIPSPVSLSLLEIQRFSPLSSSTTTSSLVESSRSRRMLPSFTSRLTTSARWHPASASASCATMRPLRTPGWARCGGGGPSPAGQAPCRGPWRCASRPRPHTRYAPLLSSRFSFSLLSHSVRDLSSLLSDPAISRDGNCGSEEEMRVACPLVRCLTPLLESMNIETGVFGVLHLMVRDASHCCNSSLLLATVCRLLVLVGIGLNWMNPTQCLGCDGDAFVGEI